MRGGFNGQHRKQGNNSNRSAAGNSIPVRKACGRKEEALELVDACKSHPFCMSCPEQTCKDTDIFRMEAEEIFGNYQKAYEIACECQSMYPDEEDFLIAEHNLKRKVK